MTVEASDAHHAAMKFLASGRRNTVNTFGKPILERPGDWVGVFREVLEMQSAEDQVSYTDLLLGAVLAHSKTRPSIDVLMASVRPEWVPASRNRLSAIMRASESYRDRDSLPEEGPTEGQCRAMLVEKALEQGLWRMVRPIMEAGGEKDHALKSVFKNCPAHSLGIRVQQLRQADVSRAEMLGALMQTRFAYYRDVEALPPAALTGALAEGTSEEIYQMLSVLHLNRGGRSVFATAENRAAIEATLRHRLVLLKASPGDARIEMAP